ncbi:MAG: hypothetical protein R3F59_25195 [Myxococcota bacterium]
MTADQLVARILSLAERLDLGEAEAAEVDDASALVRAVAPGATLEGQLAIGRSLSVLEAAVRRQLDRMGSELRQLGQGRRALSAFGTLRPHSGQRVRTKA